MIDPMSLCAEYSRAATLLDTLARREVDRALDFGRLESDLACFGPLYSARQRVKFRLAFGWCARWFRG